MWSPRALHCPLPPSLGIDVWRANRTRSDSKLPFKIECLNLSSCCQENQAQDSQFELLLQFGDIFQLVLGQFRLVWGKFVLEICNRAKAEHPNRRNYLLGLASRALTGTRLDVSCGLGEVGGVKWGGDNRGIAKQLENEWGILKSLLLMSSCSSIYR